MVSRRVTIDDVADAAGVSRQTVSNVLRGTGRVGAATAARIQEVVERLDYAPHPGASSMRSRRSGQLAYPLSGKSLEPDNVIVMEFIQSLVSAAGDEGYHVLLTSTGTTGIRELIRSGRVDGFVFSDMYGFDERLEIVDETRTPFACFGRVPGSLRQAWVDVDNAAGVHQATDHLASLGHTDIAYFGYAENAYWDTERREGYEAAMSTHGLERRIVPTLDDEDAVRSAAEGLVSSYGRPTAIVCSSDVLAVAIYRAADHAGVAIGAELSVAGFDSSVIGRSLVPALTSMRVPLDRIASLVVKQFVGEIEHPADETAGVLVVPELVLGASTAPPAR